MGDILLLRAAGQVAAAGGKFALRRIRLRWGAARAASRSLAETGLHIPPKALRAWLRRPDVRLLLETASQENLASARARLVAISGSDRPLPEEAASEAIFVVLHHYLKRVDPSAAAAIALEWQRQAIASDGEETRGVVRESSDRVLARIEISNTFDSILSTFHPWARSDAQQLRTEHPVIERCVGDLGGVDDRASLLDQWFTHRPTWLQDLPAKVALWLGNTALEYGALTSGVGFLGEAISAGVPAHDLIAARKALALAGYDPEAARAYLAGLGNIHPLGDAIINSLDGDTVGAATSLEEWDAILPRERAIKYILLGRALAASGSSGEALSRVEAELAVNEHATGLMLFVAEELLIRAAARDTIQRLTDTERAKSYALRARNQRRVWGGDSAEAAVLGVQACHLSSDPTGAWSLTQMPPDGDATEKEAADPRITRHALLTAALTGRTEAAEKLLTSVQDPYAMAEARALLAPDGTPADEVRNLWLKAWEAGNTDGDRLSVASQLASLGRGLPDLSDLASRHPEKVEEIKALHQATSSSGDLIDALRAGASKSPLVATRLAEELRKVNDHQGAGDALRAAGETFSHPTLMSMAADSYYQAGDATTAARAANSALRLGGPEWAGRAEARSLLLQIAADEGDWELATEEAKALLAVDPTDQRAVWSLASCLVQRGQLEDAWRALTAGGSPTLPRDSSEAIVWVNLHARFAPERGYVTQALQAVNPWRDRDDVLAACLMSLQIGLNQRGFNPTAEELSSLQETGEYFFKEFPESKHLRRYSIDEQGDPLQQIRPLLKEASNPNLPELLKQIRGGALPLGMLATATGTPYALTFALGGSGLFHAFAGNTPPTDVLESLSKPVVLDTSAANSLARLPREIADVLRVTFPKACTTDTLYKDAVQARMEMSARSGLTMGWDHEQGRPTVTDTPESLVSHEREVAGRIAEILKGLNRTPWAEIRTFPEDLRDLTWLSAPDYAIQNDLPLWCDDLPLAMLARSEGATVFTTMDVLNHRVASGALSSELFDVAVAALILAGHVDLGFRTEAMNLALAQDAGLPRGVALAVSRPGAWQHPGRVVDFVLSAVRPLASTDAEAVLTWVEAVSRGLVRISEDPEGSGDNLVLLLRTLLKESWLGPSQMPFVLRGIRTAAGERIGIRDPLEAALEAHYADTAAETNHELAAAALIWLFAQCDEADRTTVARVILLGT